MSFGHRLGRQLRNPRGLAGRCLGHAMALLNEQANRLTIAQLNAQPTDNVLELGFGPGRGIARLANQTGSGQVFGIDQSATMLRQARRRNARAIRTGRVHLVQGKFDCLPFPDASFDRVLAINVVYFWPPDNDILHEIDRVTKPDSRIALYATHRTSMEKWSFSQAGSHRLYDENDMKALFSDIGFPATRIDVQTSPVGFGVRGMCAIAIKGVG